MENISGKSRASFRWMLSYVTIGIGVIVSPCFAADLGASQGMQRLGTAAPEIMPLRCDSLDPKVCFDIYWRLHNEPAPPAPNWSTKFNLYYGPGNRFLGTPEVFGTVPSGK
jgi:hypothetical protein